GRLNGVVTPLYTGFHVAGKLFGCLSGRTVAIDRYSRSGRPSQDLVDGQSTLLSQDIPQRTIYRTDGRGLESTANPEGVPIHLLPVILDGGGVFTDKVLFIVQNRLSYRQVAPFHNRFRDPGDPFVGLNPHDNRVPEVDP